MADLSVKQGQAFRYLTDAKHTEVLYGGAAGGGKSWLGCLWLLASALKYQGSRWLMGRAVAKTLKETTLNSFFDVCAAHGLKSGEHYTYNQQTGTITLGASTIILKDLFSYPSDPNFDELGSLEITGAFIDEANQVTEKAKAIVGSRIRYKLDEFGLIPKMLMTCNPAKNWVFREFYQPAQDGTLPPYRAFVQALVTDNPNISPHYIDNLKKLTGPDRARLLMGDWNYDDDPSRLMDQDAINDLWTNEHVPVGKKYISADVARYGHDLTVIALWEGLRLVHFTVMEQSSVPEVAAAITQLCRSEAVPRSHVVVDDDGIGGGVVDLLPGCVAFKGGARPIESKVKPQNFANLKTQCSYVLSEHVNDREVYIATSNHRDKVSEELSHIKRDKMDNDGPLRILAKEKVKEALGRSPDFADVLMMRMVFELREAGRAGSSLAKKGERVLRQRHEQTMRERFDPGYTVRNL